MSPSASSEHLPLAYELDLGVLFHALHDAAVVVDVHAGRVLLSNAAAERLFGYTAAELSRRRLRTLVPAGVRPWLDEALAQAMLAAPSDSEGTAPQELPIITKAGEERWCEWTATLLERPQGENPCALAVARDVTDRRLAVEQLRESEERYRALVDRSPFGIAVHRDGRYIYANPALVRLLGAASPEEIVGRPLAEFVHPGRHAGLEARLRVAAASGHGYGPAEECLVRRDGREIVVEVHGSPVTFDGDPAFQAIIQDVSQRAHHLRRREALQRVSHLLAAEANPTRLLQTLLQVAIQLLDASAGQVTRWDEQSEQLRVVRGTFSPDGQVRVLSLGHGFAGRAVLLRRAVISHDYQHEDWRDEIAVRAGVRSGLGLPLLYEGRLMGALAVGRQSMDRPFTDDDLETIGILAQLAAATMVGMEKATLEGVVLAARTAQHTMNNQLALTVGYSEMLACDPRLPPDAREAALEALRGAQRAAATLLELQKLTRVEHSRLSGAEPLLHLGQADR